jgi:signal transduction histidine kinase
VFFALVLGAPALAGATVAAWTRQIRELRAVSGRLREQRAAAVRAARIEEQNRVESRVQREIIQRMGAIVIQAGGARATTSLEDARRALETIESTARDALQATREAVGVLREPADRPDQPSQAPAGIETAEPAPAWRLVPLDLLAGSCGVLVAVEAVMSGASRGPAWANVAAGLAVGAPLALRRRWPVASAAAMFAIAAAMSFRLTPSATMVTALVPVLLAAYAVGAHARDWPRRLAGLVVIGAGVIGVALAGPAASRDPEGLAPSLLWVALAVAAGTLTAIRATRAARLRQLVTELERGRDAEVRLAVAEQRHRIARDLHDCVAHAMTVVCLHAAAGHQLDGDRAALDRTLDLVLATSREGMTELRRGLEEYDEVGVEDATFDVDHVASNARLAGQDVEVCVCGDRATVPAQTGRLAARVVREALVNAARHAPGARVQVRVVHEADGVLVEVSDDGAAAGGFTEGSGSGLTMLSEWVREQGGRLEHGPTGLGYRVTARLPVPRTVPA